MAGRSSDDGAQPTTPSGIRGGVLMFSFLGPKSYAASSYPHPIKDAKEINRYESRDIALSKSVPTSLYETIESLVAEEKDARHEHTRYFTLKPGCFFMHLTCWRPEPYEAHGDRGRSFEKCPEALWMAYSWSERPGHQWFNDPSDAVRTEDGLRLIHPTLGDYVKDIRKGAKTGGNPSHVALGETSESFFIRLSDNARNWHYRYHGLPTECELAIQASMASGKETEHCNLKHWTYGRLRGVTLGQSEGWVLYREDQHETLWGGDYLPPSLVAALNEGRKPENKLIINQVVLNPQHSMEYVLAYNDGTVYYSFHHSFQEDFDRIAKQWCLGKGVEYKPRPVLLQDKHYYFSPVPETPSRAPTPNPLLQPRPPLAMAPPSADAYLRAQAAPYYSTPMASGSHHLRAGPSEYAFSGPAPPPRPGHGYAAYGQQYGPSLQVPRAYPGYPQYPGRQYYPELSAEPRYRDPQMLPGSEGRLPQNVQPMLVPTPEGWDYRHPEEQPPQQPRKEQSGKKEKRTLWERVKGP